MSETADRRFKASRFELQKAGRIVPQIALALAPIADAEACKAAGARAFTDGERIVYDPAHVLELPISQLDGLVWEEVGHVQLLHPWRMRALLDAGCDKDSAQQACEHEIAGHIAKCGGDLGEHPPCPAQFETMSMEAIAWTLHACKPPPSSGNGPGQPGNGNGQPDPNGTPQPGNGPPKPHGTVQPAPANAQAQQQGARVKAQLLAHAAGKGDLPGAAGRLVRQLLHPACQDLLAALLEFQQRTAGSGQSDWTRPHTSRTKQLGFFIPSQKARTMPPLAAAVDTSGSVSERTLELFTSVLGRVLHETEPETLHAYACDAHLQATYTLTPGDDVPSAWPGGGGTDFRPIFDAIEKLPEPPACLFILTDLAGTMPATVPDVPTLWVITDPHGARPKPPFGTCIYLD